MLLSSTSSQRWLGLLLAALLTITLFWSASAQQPAGDALSEEEFWELIDSSLTIVRSAAATPSEDGSQVISDLAERWESINGIRKVDKALSPLDNSFLVAQLRAEEPDLAGIEALLLSLKEAGQGWPDPYHDGQELPSLEAILARAEFQWPEEEPSFLERVWQFIRDGAFALLARLLPAAATGGPFVRTALTVVGVIVLALVLLYAARGLLADFAADVDAAADGQPGDEFLTSEGARQHARTLSAAGDYRSAVRYLYLSSLLILDERNLLRYDRSLTNREYLRNLSDRPDLASPLREVIDVFDRVWYGFQPLDEQAYARYVMRVDELRRQQ